jgi:DNA-binding CsgD family transcriptional regulator
MPPTLTPRERAALRLAAEGLTAQETAERLGVGRTAIDGTMERVRMKLDVATTAAAVWAARDQLEDGRRHPRIARAS